MYERRWYFICRLQYSNHTLFRNSDWIKIFSLFVFGCDEIEICRRILRFKRYNVLNLIITKTASHGHVFVTAAAVPDDIEEYNKPLTNSGLIIRYFLSYTDWKQTVLPACWFKTTRNEKKKLVQTTNLKLYGTNASC